LSHRKNLQSSGWKKGMGKNLFFPGVGVLVIKDYLPGTNVTKIRLNSKHEARNTKQIQNSNVQNSKQKEPVTLVLSFVLVI
jgi:hypothetical protein